MKAGIAIAVAQAGGAFFTIGPRGAGQSASRIPAEFLVFPPGARLAPWIVCDVVLAIARHANTVGFLLALSDGGGARRALDADPIRSRAVEANGAGATGVIRIAREAGLAEKNAPQGGDKRVFDQKVFKSCHKVSAAVGHSLCLLLI